MHKTKIAIVVSEFNQEITSKLLEGAQQRLHALQIPEKNITIAHVPGAVEIPLTAAWFAKTKQHDAIIALGCVIRGETNHYDYVCQMVSQGCMNVMLQYELPVIFGVLTTDTEEQALDRVGGAFGHKGIEAVDAAMRMIMLGANIKR